MIVQLRLLLSIQVVTPGRKIIFALLPLGVASPTMAPKVKERTDSDALAIQQKSPQDSPKNSDERLNAVSYLGLAGREANDVQTYLFVTHTKNLIRSYPIKVL